MQLFKGDKNGRNFVYSTLDFILKMKIELNILILINKENSEIIDELSNKYSINYQKSIENLQDPKNTIEDFKKLLRRIDFKISRKEDILNYSKYYNDLINEKVINLVLVDIHNLEEKNIMEIIKLSSCINYSINLDDKFNSNLNYLNEKEDENNIQNILSMTDIAENIDYLKFYYLLNESDSYNNIVQRHILKNYFSK